MILYACYIIGKDGRPLVRQLFQDPLNSPEGGLLGALLATIQGVALDLVKDQGSAEKITLAGITYHMLWMGEFFVVMVTDDDEKPITALRVVGRKFMSQYHDIIHRWNGNLDLFKSFEGPLLKILAKYFDLDRGKSLNPTKRLDTKSLFNLDKRLKDTALAIFSLNSGTPSEIAEESGETIADVRLHLDTLRELGYVGYKVKDNTLIYFC